MHIECSLNGASVSKHVEPYMTLLAFLRDVCGAVETKFGCGEGVCGTCTVLLDNAPVSSCLVLVPHIRGKSIVTIKGSEELDATFEKLKNSFAKYEAAQCGYCTPGILLMAYNLLQENSNPSESDIRHALSGNICRCTGYTHIVQAVQEVAGPCLPY